MGTPQKQPINNNIKSSISIISSITSPKSSSSSAAAAFQDSPIFNYINSLSPIKPVKGSSVIHGYSGGGFNSPPLIFTSPRINTHRHSIDLKSSQCHASSHPELVGEDENGNIRPLSKISTLNTSEDALPKMTDSMIQTEDDKINNIFAEHDHERSLPSIAKSVENDAKKGSCSQQYDQRVTQHTEPVFGYKDCGKRIGPGVANQPIATMMELHSKVGQSQLGKRRRLQFETAQDQIVEQDHTVSSTAAISEVLESSLSRNSKNSCANVSKPSGIGLHLNSIVNTMPLTYPSGGGKISMLIGSQMQDNTQCPSISSNSKLVENVSARSEEYTHETKSNAKSMMMLESQETFDQLEQAEIVDEISRSNPKKKRKKSDSSGDGCKRCNCKKTKCLKLYCDCFAAGIYCSGPCSCQGCFNRPEYEETVLETRQQIESRNPLAFAPKIIPRPIQAPIIQTEEGDHATPLAGRHKRGCNCKKSMCLKKYCECYQANVGCSDGCRCEGCQNIFGTRGVSGMVREMGMEGMNKKLNDSFDAMLKVGTTRLRSSLPELHKPYNLTPETPSIQCSNHGKDGSKARVFPGRYVHSPESECTFYPPYVSTPNDSAPEKLPLDQESYPDMEYMDEFSPGDWPNNSRAQLLPPSDNSFPSLGFCGTSVTPVTLFGRTKPTFDIIDDDTPKILKESCIRSNKVIGTSPNKKRISPPRIRLHELGSSSLKSGRKFILKSIPSFPPLTPCTATKDNTAQALNPPPGDNTLQEGPF